MLNSDQLTNNYRHVLERIQDSATKHSIIAPQLLAVSKTKPADMVQCLYEQGQRDFGENYLQDALDKIASLSALKDIRWHFIGQIQSNKTNTIAQYFDWVHSVDRLKIAKRLNDQRGKAILESGNSLSALNICLQVDLDSEDQKGGLAPSDVLELAQAVQDMKYLNLRGLMCIPQARDDFEAQKNTFAQLTELREQLQQQGMVLDTLSMGMSGDLEAAIAAGSTMVRIGSDIFGARN